MGLNDGTNGINYTPQPPVWVPYIGPVTSPITILEPPGYQQLIRVDMASVTISISTGDGACAATLFYGQDDDETPLFTPLITARLTSFTFDPGQPLIRDTQQTSNALYLAPTCQGLSFAIQGGGFGACCVFWSLGWQAWPP